MWRTALASGGLLSLAWASVAWLTMGFQVWTAEGARRLDAVRQSVVAPAVPMTGPHMVQQPLSALLSDGRVTIVDFVYTRCQSVCSALGSGFQQLQERIARDDRQSPVASLRLLSISFDPAHDTAAVLQQHASRLHADPRVWQFAAPARVADLETLLGAYGVVVIPDGMGGYQHNAALLVVDVQGRLRRIFDYGELEQALAYAALLANDPMPGGVTGSSSDSSIRAQVSRG